MFWNVSKLLLTLRIARALCISREDIIASY